MALNYNKCQKFDQESSEKLGQIFDACHISVKHIKAPKKGVQIMLKFILTFSLTISLFRVEIHVAEI
jgi:hypothetical protein